jgi:hypothetical protein
VFTTATRRNIPEDTILHSHRRENLKSYIGLFVVDFSKTAFASSGNKITDSNPTRSINVYVL